MLRLFLDGETVTVFIEFCYSIAFGIIDPIAEDCGFVLLLGSPDRFLEYFGETCAVEDVVTEDEAGGVIAYEVLADDEGLGKSVGRGLFGVYEVDAVVTSVTEEALETGEVLWGRDYEDIAYSGKHKGRDGIIDHWLVEDGEELFAYALGNRI